MMSFEEMKADEDCLCPSTNTCSDLRINRRGDRTKRLKASARERKRRHVLNDALENLRRKVPGTTQRRANSKLSKIEVLRMAIDYIAMLSCYLSYSTAPVYPCAEEYFQENKFQLAPTGYPSLQMTSSPQYTANEIEFYLTNFLHP